MTSRYCFTAKVLLVSLLGCTIEPDSPPDASEMPARLTLHEDTAGEQEVEVLDPEPSPEPEPDPLSEKVIQEQMLQERVIEKHVREVDRLNEDLADLLKELQEKKGVPASEPFVSPLEIEVTASETP